MKTIYKEDLLPKHYKEVGEPAFTGRGNHSVAQLEDIAEGYKELVHQLRVREQTLLNKLNISIVSNSVCQHCGNTLCDAQKFNSTCFNCGKTPLAN